MPNRLVACLLAAGFAVTTLVLPTIGHAQDGKKLVIEDLTGNWIDKSDAKGRISITARSGLLFIDGKDARSTWTAACIPAVTLMICKGHGLSSSGQGLLYENAVRLTKEGTLIETWFVQGGAEDAAGKTEWHRK